MDTSAMAKEARTRHTIRRWVKDLLKTGNVGARSCSDRPEITANCATLVVYLHRHNHTAKCTDIIQAENLKQLLSYYLYKIQKL